MAADRHAGAGPAGGASGKPAGGASGKPAGGASGKPAGDASGKPAGGESGQPAGAGVSVGGWLVLDIGPVAHGGHCLGRAPDGRVVFVRHVLPGERAVVRVTEQRRGYLRADAVEILVAAPGRVPPPCPHAGPPGVNADGTRRGCGGCDFQHADPDTQRELKTAVLIEALTRLGGLTGSEIDRVEPSVRPLPGGALGWRSRVRYAVAAGRAGLRAHRSHEVLPIRRCLIAVPAIQDLPVTGQPWPDASEVTAVASGTGEVTVLARRRGTTGPAARGGAPAGGRRAGGRTGAVRERVDVVRGPATVHEQAAGRRWEVPAGAFWQAHLAAPDAYVAAVLEMLRPRPGERAADLYGGAGLFAAALAGAVGRSGAVTTVESDRRGAAAARANLADLPQVRVVPSTVQAALSRLGPVDVVVLDPPRTGAGERVMRELLDMRPRAVAYVACDPAALARDVAVARTAGWSLARLRAFDAFPMTHHLECVALLLPP